LRSVNPARYDRGSVSKSFTPEQLREAAAQKRREAKAMLAEAEVYERMASELDRLQVTEQSATVQSPPVTRAQRREKNAKIARKLAPKDAFSEALEGHGETLRSYAKKLKKPPSALSQWRTGVYMIPFEIAHRIQRELGVPTEFWPKGLSIEED
jgi:hypothetical protein